MRIGKVFRILLAVFVLIPGSARSKETMHSSGEVMEKCMLDQLLAEHHQILETNKGMPKETHAYMLGDKFGLRFIEDLTSLPEDSHWLDTTPGDLGHLREFANGWYTHLVPEPNSRWIHNVKPKSKRITSVVYRKAEQYRADPWDFAGRDYRVLEGKYLEDRTLAELGTCDLITDMGGAFSRTARIDVVLRKYLELLKIGGKAYISFHPVNTSIGNNPGPDFGVREFLSRIPNIKVEWLRWDVVRIEKTGWTQGKDVPELWLKRFFPWYPPSRAYEYKH
jgi:hypothetical protein